MSDRPELIGNRQTSNKPDWTIAPEDAQFYSCGHFRKHENGVEYVWADDWEAVTVDPIDWHKKTTDFEMRPDPAWNGQGLPPVGAVCEITNSDSRTPGLEAGQKIEIIAHTTTTAGAEIAVFKFDDNEGRTFVGQGTRVRFRPIKSDKDKWLDEVIGSLEPTRLRFAEEERDICSHIYEALKSGKLPTP